MRTVADGLTGIVPVRDSRTPGGPAVVFGAHAWSVFIGQLKTG